MCVCFHLLNEENCILFFKIGILLFFSSSFKNCDIFSKGFALKTFVPLSDRFPKKSDFHCSNCFKQTSYLQTVNFADIFYTVVIFNFFLSIFNIT